MQEKQVKIASRMYDVRDRLIAQLSKDSYKEHIIRWGNVIKKESRRRKRTRLQTVISICKELTKEHGEFAPTKVVIAAYVELLEPTEGIS